MSRPLRERRFCRCPIVLLCACAAVDDRPVSAEMDSSEPTIVTADDGASPDIDAGDEPGASESTDSSEEDASAPVDADDPLHSESDGDPREMDAGPALLDGDLPADADARGDGAAPQEEPRDADPLADVLISEGGGDGPEGGCSELRNVAVGADASLSDEGWGGGVQKADLTDGLMYYCDTWAHGLAFTGGPSGWTGVPCGWRQLTLDLGATNRLHQASFYHRAPYHIPDVHVLEASLDGNVWFVIADHARVREDLTVEPAGCWGATPTEHDFAPVVARFVRFRFDNCMMLYGDANSHGWVYEAMLMGCSP